MKELDFTKRAGITVKMPDGEFLLRKPTMAQIKKLESEQGKKLKSPMDPVVEMLESLGLPQEQVMQLDSDQITALTDALMPEKKRQ